MAKLLRIQGLLNGGTDRAPVFSAAELRSPSSSGVPRDSNPLGRGAGAQNERFVELLYDDLSGRGGFVTSAVGFIRTCTVPAAIMAVGAAQES